MEQKKTKKLTPAKVILMIFAACMTFVILYSTYSAIVYINALSHGADEEKYTREYVLKHPSEVLYSTIKSHKAAYDYEPGYGDVVIYYRFGCKDCEQIYDELKKDVEDSGINVVWIATRTSNGKALLEYYPVKEVPTLILIKKSGEYEEYKPYTLNDKGEADYDETLIPYLKELQDGMYAEIKEQIQYLFGDDIDEEERERRFEEFHEEHERTTSENSVSGNSKNEETEELQTKP